MGWNLQAGPRPEEDREVARAGRELNQEVNRLMVAMRDMLANIQFQEPPREDNPERDEEEEGLSDGRSSLSSCSGLQQSRVLWSPLVGHAQSLISHFVSRGSSKALFLPLACLKY
ncbi:hypothetical protein ANANG_G00203220 [Anguilla anguilla]|uniref:Uncharacterized protein n=1 Tax=Anguilla anguilla TaxID=7936 RepID=A0A9D3LYB2_ANGAN|nr:hypothetical protein ANANG_G00203220 [Anguilla anguilla]